MADVTIDPQNSNPKELYGQGVRAFILQDYDTAVKALSRASELLAEEHQNELDDSLGDVYLYYGKALLELSRKESGPLGEAVLKNVEEESEEEEEEVEEEQPESDKVEEKSEEAKEEELTDLQVAWEVLELAKKIFTTRGNDGRKNLAETLIVLGEISLESGNFPPAIEDISEGLKIQKTLFPNDSRTIAETFYKLGGAYSTNGQIEEAINNFSSSLEYIRNKIANLEKENKEDELEELKNLVPEIEEKIADMKNLKVEIANKVKEVKEEPVSNGKASSSKEVNDISHLVKKKRKSEETENEAPAKKPSP